MNVTRFDPTEKFSPEEMANVRARSDLTGTLCILHAWAVIAACMVLFAVWPNPLTFIVAVILIGSRQLGLAILMHDGAHGALMRTRGWNEWAGQWLCGNPIWADMIAYRHYHLVHHRRTQQRDDPDYALSAPFPITRTSFRRKLIRDITGQTGFKQRSAQIRNALGKPGEPFAQRFATFREKLGAPIVANLVLLAILTAAGRWYFYPLFWLLPLLTWQQVITRVRNIAEHAIVPDNDDVFRNARTTYASWWERGLFAPYWVNYHVDHHLLFYVPCYNLPKLHAMLLAKGYGPRMEIQTSYLAVWRMATSRPEVAQAV
jgi:fatty acid desaturase